MDSILKKPTPKFGGYFYTSAYRLFMRRNSVYVPAVDYGVKKIWESNNKWHYNLQVYENLDLE
ncbi:hypothetical protein MKX01_006912 [Papaver californicum]|nr:hypothetical protein MKX01_006912 [Papaver californicum]